MTIAFNEVPANLRVPGIYVEIDGTGAAADQTEQPFAILVVGQKLDTGDQNPNVPVRITSEGQARAAFGRGSMLAGMAATLLANNRFTEAFYLAMGDPGAGVAATGQFIMGASTPSAGTIQLMVAGTQVQVAVAAGDSPNAVAVAAASAINALPDLPVTAAVDGSGTNRVDLTARHAGTIGNSIDLRYNYFEGQSLPNGITVTVTPMAGGTGEPDLAAALAGLPDDQYQVIAFPYTDTALLVTLEAELEDRFGPTRMNPGVAFTATTEPMGAAAALGESRNSSLLSIMHAYGSPTPVWSWAVALAGVVAQAGAIDPARPFQTLPLGGVLAPEVQDRLLDAERNLLLYDGISTSRVAGGGKVTIERLITTYKENALEVPDVAFLDVNSLLTLDRLRFELRARMALRFPRAKLGNDGEFYGQGQVIVTPTAARAEVIALFESWIERGLVEGSEQFARDLLVERNATDPNRLDLRLAPDLLNQLRIFGAQVSFLR